MQQTAKMAHYADAAIWIMELEGGEKCWGGGCGSCVAPEGGQGAISSFQGAGWGPSRPVGLSL